MKPVFQNKFGNGQGNCVAACLASIFELPLDKVTLPPPTDEEVRAWTEANFPNLEYHYEDLALNLREEETSEGLKWTYDLPDAWKEPTEGYWMASVNSPALKRAKSDAYWPLPALHAVVMRGADKAHDPNPRYTSPYPLEMVMLGWWTERKTPLGRDRT